jgi:aryl-alcohol dehydrogenase-like predicted oxidoreductase
VRLFARQRTASLLQGPPEEINLPKLNDIRDIVRCMLGSGLIWEALPLLTKLASSAYEWSDRLNTPEHRSRPSLFTAVDGDLVQAMTAIEKALSGSSGTRQLTTDEKHAVQDLFDTLRKLSEASHTSSSTFVFDRGLRATGGVLGASELAESIPDSTLAVFSQCSEPSAAKETFTLGQVTVPRIFSGLWQMSSPAWGSASTANIFNQFSKIVNSGFTAFDMADHYGDAELIFGRFRSLYPYKHKIFAATKICIFQRLAAVSREIMAANVSERCRRLQQTRLDLVQFHWQYYEDTSYIDALQYLAADDRVGQLGLCNFDTVNMKRVIDAGINICSNQVQFSLIDSRPLEKMAAVCDQHNIKLLTYGTLCGGFLSDKWLGRPEPDLYGSEITPSQRKYHAMIANWGGWDLLQKLLQVLRGIATKHDVPGISNVATRWVLDWPCVGAVLVGARMGVSDHSDANLASFGWRLDAEDRALIEEVLGRSKRKEVFEKVGDCGAEYRV